MIMMAAFSSFLPPELALAGLILPTFVTNLSQAFRQGLQPALGTMRRYWRMLVATVVFIVISSAFVYIIPHTLFLLLLGVPITAFAIAQLAGLKLALKLPPPPGPTAEVLISHPPSGRSHKICQLLQAIQNLINHQPYQKWQ
jgi:uncharacterized membrane protein YfcA